MLVYVPMHIFFCSFNTFSRYIIILSIEKSLCMGNRRSWVYRNGKEEVSDMDWSCVKGAWGWVWVRYKFLPRKRLSTRTESPGKWSENKACLNWRSICSLAHSLTPGNCVVQGQKLDLMILVDPFCDSAIFLFFFYNGCDVSHFSVTGDWPNCHDSSNGMEKILTTMPDNSLRTMWVMLTDPRNFCMFRSLRWSQS